MRSRRVTRVLSIAALAAGMAALAGAQQLPPDRAGLERGIPGWMVELPETYRYFGPDIVLAHRDTLGLGPGQTRSIVELYDRMHESVLQKGKLIIAAEEDLEDMFATGKISEESAARQAELIGKMRGELRALYLGAAITMHKILNDRQRAILAGLRAAAQPMPPEIR